MTNCCACWSWSSLTSEDSTKRCHPPQSEPPEPNVGTPTPDHARPDRATFTYKHGIHWRMQEILLQACHTDDDQLHRLTPFVHKILDAAKQKTKNGAEAGTSSARRGDDLHAVLEALPQDEGSRQCCRELLQVLEKGGFGMSLLNASRDTPLLSAIKAGNRAALDALLWTRKCDINATDRYSSTCLIYAVKWRDRDTARSILQQFGRGVNLDKADYASFTALAYAACNNDLELCALLLEAGARTDVNSTSPLFQAISNDASLELIQLLVSKGASVNVSNSEGLNAIAVATRNRKPEILSLLLQNGAILSPVWHKTKAFRIALERDQLDVLKLLIQHGTDVTCANPKGCTVIHEACHHGSVQALFHLVQTTAVDLDARNRQRCSAAHCAAQQGHGACLEVLFRAGADCWSLDPRGQSIVEIALLDNRSQCVPFLVEHPVFPRHRLFSALHVLRGYYDPASLGRKAAVGLFETLLRERWEVGNEVDTLMNTCLISVRRLLGQMPSAKVMQLPLPEKIKERILSYG